MAYDITAFKTFSFKLFTYNGIYCTVNKLTLQ